MVTKLQEVDSVIKVVKERLQKLDELKSKELKKVILIPKFVYGRVATSGETVSAATDIPSSDVVSPLEFAEFLTQKLEDKLESLNNQKIVIQNDSN